LRPFVAVRGRFRGSLGIACGRAGKGELLRVLIQRVSRAKVTSGGELLGSIGPGLCVFLGVAPGDTEANAAKLADKVVNLRLFDDGEGRMNLSVKDTGGGLLVVSQFTLMADTRRGRRPNFSAGAAPPELAVPLYGLFLSECEKIVTTERGRFGAMMEVDLVNDGPVTLIVDDPAP
jgi:D-tyrosyl-tRNA(Tyr) deacylase